MRDAGGRIPQRPEEGLGGRGALADHRQHSDVRAHRAAGERRDLTGAPLTGMSFEVPRLFRPEALVEIGVVAAVAG